MARKTGKANNGQALGNEARGGITMNEDNGTPSRVAGESADIATEEIAARAYDIYQREGRVDGRDMEHWLRAEAELREEREHRKNMPRSARLQQEQRDADISATGASA